MALLLTAETLREELGSHNYRMLTQNDDENAEKALRKAKIFVASVFKRANKESDYDELDDSTSEAVVFRALFELYVKVKQYDYATKARNESQAILINILGAVADIYTDDNMVGNSRSKTTISSIKGKSKWNGYS